MFPRQADTNVKLIQSVVARTAAWIPLPAAHPKTEISKDAEVASAVKAKKWLFSMVVHQDGGNDTGVLGQVAP